MHLYNIEKSVDFVMVPPCITSLSKYWVTIMMNSHQIHRVFSALKAKDWKRYVESTSDERGNRNWNNETSMEENYHVAKMIMLLQAENDAVLTKCVLSSKKSSLEISNVQWRTTRQNLFIATSQVNVSTLCH